MNKSELISNSIFENKYKIQVNQKEVRFKNQNTSFSNQFKNEYRKQIHDEFWKMLDSLEELSQVFFNIPSLHNLYKYKSLLEKILNRILLDTFCIQNIYGRKIDHKVILVLNRKIENLFEYILNNQKTQLNILNQFHEIKGILIDYFS